MSFNWRDIEDPDPTDDDEDVPCHGYVAAVLGFDPDELDWSEQDSQADADGVENAGVKDEARDAHGRWTAGGDIPTALRPKTKAGLYFKSEELHAAAADDAKAEALFKDVAAKDKGKFARLMQTLREAKEGEKLADVEAPVPLSGEDLESALSHVKVVAGKVNLAKLSALREKMRTAGMDDFFKQDALLLELQRQGKIGLSSPEGRHQTSEEERQSWLRAGGQTYGHVYVRNAGTEDELRDKQGKWVHGSALKGKPVEDVPVESIGYDSKRSMVEVQFDVAQGVKSKTTSPIIVDEKDNVIDGAHRLEEARARGDKTVKAIRVSRAEHAEKGDEALGIRKRDDVDAIRKGKAFDDWMDKHYYLVNAEVGEESRDAHGRWTEGETPSFKVKPPKKLYRGVMASGEGAGVASLGKGLYSTPRKAFLKGFKYDNIVELNPEDAFPRNPLVLRSANDFVDWLLLHSGHKNMRTFGAEYKDPGEFVKLKGYDGVIAGEEVVKYQSETRNAGMEDELRDSRGRWTAGSHSVVDRKGQVFARTPSYDPQAIPEHFALPDEQQMFEAVSRASGGTTTDVGKLYRAAQEASPDLSLEDFHRQMISWTKRDLIVTAHNNDPRLSTAEELASHYVQENAKEPQFARFVSWAKPSGEPFKPGVAGKGNVPAGPSVPSSQDNPKPPRTAAAHMLIQRLAGGAGQASLAKVREKLASAGINAQEEQDAAMAELGQQGKIDVKDDQVHLRG